MSTSPRVFVQHHPARTDLLGPLLASVPDAVVVTDPEPTATRNPWRTYRQCLEVASDDPCTHAVVIQDDATVCRDFPAALEAAVASRPDSVLALFHGGSPRENRRRLDLAHARGDAWAVLDSRRWVPVVALVWPKRLVCPAVCWVADQDYPDAFRADDEIVGRALRALGEPVLACVPSIVQHEDAVPSLVGQRARAGADPGRVAARWIGDADPGAINWTTGAAA